MEEDKAEIMKRKKERRQGWSEKKRKGVGRKVGETKKKEWKEMRMRGRKQWRKERTKGCRGKEKERKKGQKGGYKGGRKEGKRMK